MLALLLPSFLIATCYSLSEKKEELINTEETNYFWIEVGIILTLAIVLAFMIAKISKKKRTLVLYIIVVNVSLINVLAAVINAFVVLSNLLDQNKATRVIIATIIGALAVSIVWITTILKGKREKNGKIRNICTIIISSNLGTILALIFPIGYYLIIIVVLAVFDIYSVFKGPVKEIFSTPEYSKVKYSDTVGIGFGDLVLYASLVVFFAFNYGIEVGLYALINIIVGVKITLELTRKYKKFPGLPIPTAVVLISGYLAVGLAKIL